MENENSEQWNASERMLYLLQKEILTFEEACIYLGRNASSMHKLISGRLIPYYVPTGKLIYFKKSEIDVWALRHGRESKEKLENEMSSFLSDEHGRRQKH